MYLQLLYFVSNSPYKIDLNVSTDPIHYGAQESSQMYELTLSPGFYMLSEVYAVFKQH